MIRALFITLALVAMVALLVRLSPTGDRGASQPAVQGQMPAGDRVAAKHPAVSADRAPKTGSGTLSAITPDRDVTPSGFTRSQRAGETLERLPPRPPLSTPASEAEERPRARRQALLPRPIALDAAHLQIGDGIIVLSGIAPLTMDRTCGTGANAWPCGMRARTALRGYLRSRSVRCEVPEDFGEKRETVESTCTLQGDDIGDWLVRNGWAKATTGGPYAAAEASARQHHRGLWR